MARRLALLTFVALLLSGCSGGSPEAPADAAGPAGGGDGDGAAGPASSVEAPAWQVGQWWEWQTEFATGTREDTFCSIVLATGDTYTVVTEQEGMAKEEAAFDHPLLGAIAARDLAFDGWSEDPWSLLDFPLTDGKSYTRTMPNIAWDIFPAEGVEVTLTATFLEGDGPRRVALQGASGEHVLLEGVYDSATGWFSELTFYDVDPGQDPLEITWRAVATGTNYTGPYFQAQGEQVLDWFDGAGFTDDPTSGGQPFADPHPYVEFAVAGGEGNIVYGAVGAFAVGGARAVVFLDPANHPRYVHAADPMLDGQEVLLWLDEPAVAGTWRMGTGGAGGATAAFAELFELTMSGGTL